MSSAEVLQSIIGRQASRSGSGQGLKAVAHHVARAARTVHIPVAGFLLVAADRHGVQAVDIARYVAVGLVLAGLARVFNAILPTLSGETMLRSGLRALRAAATVTLAFGAIVGCSVLITGDIHLPSLLPTWWAVSAVVAALLNVSFIETNRVIVVGEPERARTLARRIKASAGAEGIDLVASLDARSENDLSIMHDLVAGRSASTVVVTAGLDDAILRSICVRLSDTTARVQVALAPGAVPAASLPMADLLPPPVVGVQWAAKRGFDLLVTLLLLPALFPVLVLVALAIRLETPGPVFFRQWRFGQGSRPVRIFKFRTMRTELGDTTGAARTLARDPRVTKVGRVLRRLSLDELPQLLNVLRGDMSLVGPRPHATEMKVEGQLYHEAVEVYRARHRMLPGITGWAQINGSRGEVDTMEKAQRRVQLDLWYIANWSPMLDMWILVRTAFGGFATLKAD